MNPTGGSRRCATALGDQKLTKIIDDGILRKTIIMLAQDLAQNNVPIWEKLWGVASEDVVSRDAVVNTGSCFSQILSYLGSAASQ